MNKILIIMYDKLAACMKAAIPTHQHSKVIAHLIDQESEKRARALYECALAVEKDAALTHDMAAWDITAADGLNDKS